MYVNGIDKVEYRYAAKLNTYPAGSKLIILHG
jgi:hypothetical protein